MTIRPTRQERAWLRRLQALVDSRPAGTWVFVTSDSISLMRLGPFGPVIDELSPESYGGKDGVAREYEVGYVTTRGWDHGLW